MKVQAIGRTSYLILVTAEELCRDNLSVDGFTNSDAERIYNLALPDVKNRVKGNAAYLEVYPGKDELMIFVRFGGDEMFAFEFENFEDVLMAVKLCPEMCRSELLYDGERYILILTPWDGDPIPESVNEFGERMDMQPQYLPYLREHCVRIIPGNAVEKLVSVF